MSAEQELKVVAYRVDWPAEIGIAPDRFYGADDAHRMNCHLSYVHGVAAPIVVPLVRLTDAQSALESERQAHAAEVERLRGMLQLKFTEEQCIDLFAAALYISARGDETSVLSEENAERIAELLCDLSGVDLTAAIARGKT